MSNKGGKVGSREILNEYRECLPLGLNFIDRSGFVLGRNLTVYDDIKDILKKLENEYVLSELSHVTLEDFSKRSGINFNYSYLFERKGIENLSHLYEISVSEIKLILGDFSDTAEIIRMAIDEVYENAKSTYNFSFNFENLSDSEIKLMALVQEYVEYETTLGNSESLLRSYSIKIADLGIEIKKLSGNKLIKYLNNSKYKMMLTKAEDYNKLVKSDVLLNYKILIEKLELTTKKFLNMSREMIVENFELEANTFLAILSRLNDEVPRVSRHQYLNNELVTKIERTPLNLSLMKATLRSYQLFGTKFAVCQKRVILGDEMGLGKTLQAIAAISHYSAEGLKQFLVICPGSVLKNWEKEFERHSNLKTTTIHGYDKHETIVKWLKEGGVAITTYDTIKNIELPKNLTIDCLIVDEAHFAKNWYTKRGNYISTASKQSKNLIFLSGTPLENRVEEFMVLINYVDSNLLKNLSGYAMFSGPSAFRVAVAPIYLRRNVKDVLNELPDVIHKDNHCSWKPGYDIKYYNVVYEGHYMTLRQFAYSDRGEASTKIEMIKNIIDEAIDRGLSVAIYSYFLKTLELISNLYPKITIGPLTGQTSPIKRLEMVEKVNKGLNPKILTAQIQAGGVGLNIQGASVVILCEPQIKPSLESQAIARSHRMGQLRKVEVHRMIISDSIDSHMVNLLSSKQYEFDEYAAISELSDMAPEYKKSGISASKLIELERKRLGISSDEGVVDNADNMA